jgi:2-oxoisovalerate dehydrogenase E1 component alpha subunit
MTQNASVNILRDMVRTMVLARTLDTAATNLQRQGELALWPSLLGQEAAHAGMAAALQKSDVVFPTYREQGVLLARGIPAVELLGLYRGTTLGGWDPYRYNCFLSTLVISAQTLHGVGFAMGIQRDAERKEPGSAPGRAVLVCLGDGAFSQGEANEAFVWAAAQNAPVVFFCQNNQWAISSPTSVQSTIPLHERGLGFGIPNLRIDGNDALQCFEATKDALMRARQGGGPTLIEALTYRLNAHTTSDDDSRYRTDDEKQLWRDRDPIRRAQQRLREISPEADADIAAIEQEAAELDEEIRRECREMADPDPRDPFTFTLCTMTTELRDQAETYMRHFEESAHQ